MQKIVCDDFVLVIAPYSKEISAVYLEDLATGQKLRTLPPNTFLLHALTSSIILPPRQSTFFIANVGGDHTLFSDNKKIADLKSVTEIVVEKSESQR